MTFNFRLRKCINFSKFSKAGNTEIIPALTSRLLRVDVSPTGSRKKILIGKITPIYQGFSDSVSYKIYSESQLILLPDIGMHSLRFVSSGMMKFGAVRFFEKIGQLSDTELRNVQILLGMVAEVAVTDVRNLESLVTSSTIEFRFVQSDLVDGILSTLNTLPTAPSSVMVYDDFGEAVMIDFRVFEGNILADLSDFIPIAGTWKISITN